MVDSKGNKNNTNHNVNEVIKMSSSAPGGDNNKQIMISFATLRNICIACPIVMFVDSAVNIDSNNGEDTAK